MWYGKLNFANYRQLELSKEARTGGKSEEKKEEKRYGR